MQSSFPRRFSRRTSHVRQVPRSRRPEAVAAERLRVARRGNVVYRLHPVKKVEEGINTRPLTSEALGSYVPVPVSRGISSNLC